MKPSFLKSIAIVLTLAVAPLTISNAKATVNVGSYVGNWKPSITYAGGDLITYSNQTFLSLVKNKAKTPKANPKVWQVFGVGPQGVTGPIGPQGVTGPIGPQGLAGIDSQGTATGDMQFWDGNNWVMIPAPVFISPNTVLEIATLHFCSNSTAPTWKKVCDPSNNNTYLIGSDGPAGGKVFYVTDAGLHGLEAAPVDQTSAIWGCYLVSIATSPEVGAGAANTARIVSNCSDPNTAAKIADAYSLNGYNDWYLPSIGELKLLYAQKVILGGFANNYYWSSTELSDSSGKNQFFDFGFTTSYASKFVSQQVRAIRTF